MTPGPWKWVEERGGVYRLIGADGTVVADDGSAWGEYGGWMNSPDEPNARLIAAAPDLLQGCQEALDVLEDLQGGCTDSDDGTVEALTIHCPEVINNLLAAIAKARGEK